MKKDGLSIVFWGALWGIAEATLGYVLHRAAIAVPGLPGFVMFPVAFYFMRHAYKATGKAQAVVSVAAVAAMIKCVDFLVPGNDPIRIVNPALSIMVEGLAVALVFAYTEEKGTAVGFVHSLSMGVLWRGLFLGYLFLISLFGLPAALVTDGIRTSLRFLLLESFVNACLMYGILKAGKTAGAFELRPAYAYAALLAALILQIAL